MPNHDIKQIEKEEIMKLYRKYLMNILNDMGFIVKSITSEDMIIMNPLTKLPGKGISFSIKVDNNGVNINLKFLFIMVVDSIE